MKPRKKMTPAQRKRRAYELRLWKKYGLTPAQVRKMLKLQGHRCKICRKLGHLKASTKTRRRLYIDHDHKGENRVRGLICFRCNHRLLGRGLEDSWLHRAAAEYLDDTFDARNL